MKKPNTWVLGVNLYKNRLQNYFKLSQWQYECPKIWWDFLKVQIINKGGESISSFKGILDFQIYFFLQTFKWSVLKKWEIISFPCQWPIALWSQWTFCVTANIAVQENLDKHFQVSNYRPESFQTWVVLRIPNVVFQIQCMHSNALG